MLPGGTGSPAGIAPRTSEAVQLNGRSDRLPDQRCPDSTGDDGPSDELPDSAGGSEELSGARLQALAQCFLDQAHQALLEAPPAATDLVDYLGRRGFALDQLATTPLGWFPRRLALLERLLEAGFSPDEIKASWLLADRRLPGRLVGPLRDARGRIVSFWALNPLGDQPNYLFWEGGPAHRTATLDLELPSSGRGTGPAELVLIQDLLDASLFQSRGLAHVAAIGGPASAMTPGRWERLADAGLDQVTLALRLDDRTVGSVLAAVKNAFRARRAPQVQVLVPDRRSPLAVPEPWVPYDPQSIGAGGAFRGQPLHSYRFMALAILRRHQPGRRWTDGARIAAWAEALAVYESRRPEQTAELDRHFAPPFAQELGIPLTGRGPWRETAAWTPPEMEERPATAPSDAPHQAEFCSLHRCPKTDCFCFD